MCCQQLEYQLLIIGTTLHEATDDLRISSSIISSAFPIANYHLEGCVN